LPRLTATALRGLTDHAIAESKSADDTAHTADRLIHSVYRLLPPAQRTEIREAIAAWEAKQ